MSDIYLRPQLAADLAKKLLRPSTLDTRLRSGLFLSGASRTGKTSFLMHDLIPALQQRGALVIYANLRDSAESSPFHLTCHAIQKTLLGPRAPTPSRVERFLRVLGVGSGFKFKFDLNNIGRDDGATLAEVMTTVVDQRNTDVVLIVDDVQQVFVSDKEQQLLSALKATRDAVNLRKATPGYFIVIGVGSPPAMVNELRSRNVQPFYGTVLLDYPVLGQNYVEFLLAALAKEGYSSLPGVDVATEAFKTLDYRPEELIRALRRLLLDDAPDITPDELLPRIVNTLITSAANV